MEKRWIEGKEVRNRYGLFQVDLLNAIVDGIETLDERGLKITFEHGQVIFQNLDGIEAFGTLEGIIEGVDGFFFNMDQIHARYKDRQPQAKPELVSINSIIDPTIEYHKLKPIDKGIYAKQWKEAGYIWADIIRILYSNELKQVEAGYKEYESIYRTALRWAQKAGYNPEQ